MDDEITQSAPFRDGWRAHKDGIISDDNPYSERLQRYSNREWQDGWCARFRHIKSGYVQYAEALDADCY